MHINSLMHAAQRSCSNVAFRTFAASDFVHNLFSGNSNLRLRHSRSWYTYAYKKMYYLMPKARNNSFMGVTSDI